MLLHRADHALWRLLLSITHRVRVRDVLLSPMARWRDIC